jgi:hypothetical protein
MNTFWKEVEPVQDIIRSIEEEYVKKDLHDLDPAIQSKSMSRLWKEIGKESSYSKEQYSDSGSRFVRMFTVRRMTFGGCSRKNSFPSFPRIARIEVPVGARFAVRACSICAALMGKKARV